MVPPWTPSFRWRVVAAANQRRHVGAGGELVVDPG